jgi:hypothetical protein
VHLQENAQDSLHWPVQATLAEGRRQAEWAALAVLVRVFRGTCFQMIDLAPWD